MATVKEFSQLIKKYGVKQYIIVKNNGTIMAQHHIEEPDRVADFVLACGRNCDASGSVRFRFLLFSSSSCENFFVFPVGNYYLGMVQEQDADDRVLVKNILTSINDLSKKRSLKKSSGKMKP